MSTARYLIGDVFDALATIPDGSVDLVVTSPPFLALRSYLPADDPLKAKEIGSEATPAAFLDVMLAVTAELRRVLADHGSIAVEFGDTYAGSGGAGGDYNENGWRDGQEPFRQARNTRASHWSTLDAQWLAAIIDGEGAVYVNRDERKTSVHYAPMLSVAMRDGDVVMDRILRITGVGSVTRSNDVVTWTATGQQARYVLANIWHLLMVKQDRAKAAIELGRHIEAGRGGRGASSPTSADLEYRETIRRYITTRNDKGGNRDRYAVDWEPPTPPVLRHTLMAGSEWPEPKSRALIPELYRVALAYGHNPLTGQPSPAGRWRIRNVVTWCRPNPPVGALGDKWRPATSDVVVACTSTKRYWDDLATRNPLADSPGNRYVRKVSTLDNERRPDGSQAESTDNRITKDYDPSQSAGAPLLDWWNITPGGYRGAHYAVFPPDLVVPLVKAMGPQRVCQECGEPSRREVGKARYESTVGGRVVNQWDGQRRGENVNQWNVDGGNPGHAVKVQETTGWSDCGHDNWRPGHCLDPFAGTGTTLAVATGHGLTATGIDIDHRNADLALQRLGMFLDHVEEVTPR